MYSIFHESLRHEAEGRPFPSQANKKLDIWRIHILAKAESAHVGRVQQAGGHGDRQLPGGDVSVLHHAGGKRVAAVTLRVRFRSLVETSAVGVDKILIRKGDTHWRYHCGGKRSEEHTFEL